MVEIDFPGLWEADSGKFCELVELYRDSDGQYTSFSKTNIHSLKELEDAHSDVKRDGINTWFSENGIFTWNSEDKFWNWKRNK